MGYLSSVTNAIPTPSYGGISGGDILNQGVGGAVTSGLLNQGTIATSNTLGKANPWQQRADAARKAKNDANANASDLYNQTEGINAGLGQTDADYKTAFGNASQNYLGGAQTLTDKYTNQINDLIKQSKSQGQDATKVYTNTVQPDLKNALGIAKTNANQAMSLSEASDPNNPIMKQIRELYNQQGQQALTQGKQDYGVLSALGAQAAGSQFGAAGPMTAGQQGQIYAANQQQAGNAYAAAQKRMTDLQNQGLNKSFDQSNQLYQYGQQAQDTYGNAIKNLQNGQSQYDADQGAFRQEQNGFSGNIYGANQGLNSDKYNTALVGAGIDKGNAYAGAGREQDALNTLHGVQQQGINNQQAASMANANATSGLLSSLFGAAGTVGGAAVGASDKRMKTKINDVSNSDIDEFLGAVKPKTFLYKDDGEPGTAPGKRIGFMMQDVQGTKLGDAMTRRGPGGQLMYDKDNLSGVLLAALSRQAKGKNAA